MTQALGRRKNPKRELCRWFGSATETSSIFDSDFDPDVANPVVFHLHGYIEEIDSMVVTEDDYLDFLVSISKDQNLLPPAIRAAFSRTSLLFMGYRLADWDVRVLVRTLGSYVNISNASTHVSVQLTPDGPTVTEDEKKRTQKLFDRYFRNQRICVYWGTCREFCKDLRTRWESRNGG